MRHSAHTALAAPLPQRGRKQSAAYVAVTRANKELLFQEEDQLFVRTCHCHTCGILHRQLWPNLRQRRRSETSKPIEKLFCAPTRSEKTHAASFLDQRRATGNGSRSIAIFSALRKSDSHQKYKRWDAQLIRKKLLATVNPALDRATHAVSYLPRC